MFNGGYNHTKSEETLYQSLQKSPKVKVFAKFQWTSVISPEWKKQKAKQNWYRWHTFDALYIDTKFHLDHMRGSWDTETPYWS